MTGWIGRLGDPSYHLTVLEFGSHNVVICLNQLDILVLSHLLIQDTTVPEKSSFMQPGNRKI